LVLREASGHAVEEPLSDLSHGDIFNPREVLRLRLRTREKRGKGKGSRNFAQDDDVTGIAAT
jgi:hypothetical protein